MPKNLILPEKLLYEIWKKQNFEHPLKCVDEEIIEIISPGIENISAEGPDFQNCKIKIGNITYNGDIEIDVNYSDWKNHGHNLNKKYNKVVLHLYLNSVNRLPFVYTQDSRKINSLGLRNFINSSLVEDVQSAIRSSRSDKKANKIVMPCIDETNHLSEKDKLNFLFQLGTERFKTKCNRLLEHLKEISYLKQNYLKEPVIRYENDENYLNKKFNYSDFTDSNIWYELIFEQIFEALGYSNNKDIMLKLAQSLNIEIFKKFVDKPDRELYFESILFHVSGLFHEEVYPKDEESSIYFKQLIEKWNEAKPLYDGKRFKDTQWKFGGIRPPNLPTIRLAGGASILVAMLCNNLIGRMISEINVENDYKKIIKNLRTLIIVPASGYWKTHYNFDLPAKEEIKSFIGLARADEIIVNVLLPVAALYFQIFDKTKLFQKVMGVYANFYQTADNTLVNDISKALNLKDAWKRSILYQGMIELFRSYCTGEKCSECLIGQRAFELSQ